MFDKILVANRGEIAARIMATCSRLGVATVAVHSAADADSFHVRTADEAVDLGDGPASTTYLDIGKIVRAALDTGAQAVHPGYGFLAENAAFAKAVSEAGLAFIGPSPDAIATMGEKVAARAVATAAQVPLLPGSPGPVADAETVLEFGTQFGYPVLIKASYGGGGRGMRQVSGPDAVPEAFASAVREATAAFGNGEVYVERYLLEARHVEVQVLGDTHGTIVYVGDRDCSVQRRHQKLIEEAPAPGLSDDLRSAMGEAAVRLASEVGYTGAGTVEFLVEGDKFYFLEMNTRIQVEHPVTEAVFGLDIVAEQLRVAAGEPLTTRASGTANGWAIEARINAEDVAGGQFLPAPGPISDLSAPSTTGLRWDGGYEAGDEVLPLYDSLIGKLVAWAPDRTSAIELLLRGLDELKVVGIPTTAPAAAQILRTPEFRAGEINTRWLESSVVFEVEDTDEPLGRDEAFVAGRWFRIPYFDMSARDSSPHPTVATTEASSPAQRTARSRTRQARSSASDGTVKAPMQGTIVKVEVTPGATVQSGDVLFVLEAMKMENPVSAPHDGVIENVPVSVGDSLPAGGLLAEYAKAVN